MEEGSGIHVHAHRGRRFPLTKAAAVIAIAAVIVAVVALGLQGVPTVTSGTTLHIREGQSAYFKLAGNGNTYVIYLENSTVPYSVIYVSEVPVLVHRMVAFGLAPGQSVNISTSGSATADLQVKLMSSASSNASVKLLSIPDLFTIKASPGIEVRYPASFYSSSSTPPPIIITPPAVAQNTTSTQSNNATSGKTSSQSTTPTTAPAPTSTTTPLENISAILNTTYMGVLMNNYEALYSKDTACNVNEYNTTFIAYRNQIPGASGQLPVGIFDFANASRVTPTGVTVSATQQGKGLYAVTYSVNTPSAEFSGPIATFNISGVSGVLTNVKFKGLFYGENYTTLNTAYKFQAGITGTCGAYIP